MTKTHSIPYCIMSVFSSIVTDLVLIYEFVTSSASGVCWLTLNSWSELLNSRTNYDSFLVYKSLRKNDEWISSWFSFLQWLSWIMTDLRMNSIVKVKVKVKVTLQLMVSQSVSLGVEPLLLFDSYSLCFVGSPLWREDRSVFYICCWPSPA
jgi:hypothetical protein